MFSDMFKQPNKEKKHIWLRRVLVLLIAFFILLIAVIPGALQLMRRADARSALGHAKSVRTALLVTSKEAYGKGSVFADATQPGGVREGLWEEIIRLSKVPGDFWLLKTDDTGYVIEQFVYVEGDFAVWYHAERGYKVEYMTQCIGIGWE